MLVKNNCTCCIYNNANSWSILDTTHISWFPVWVTIQCTPPWVYFGLQPIFPKILNFFDHSMLSVATLNVATESIFCTHYITDKFIFCKVGGGGRGLDVWGYWKRDTTRDLYFSFPWVSISWSLIIKFNRIWPVMFIMTVIFIIGNLSWTVCSLTGSPIHKAAGIKWSAFKELFTEYWHTGTNSRHNKSNPMSWLVLDIKYRSKDVLQTM